MTQTKMQTAPAAKLEAPRVENGKALLIAGIREHYSGPTMNNIPAQWQRFAPHIGKIPGHIGQKAYGVCFELAEPGGGIDYLTGVEVANSSNLPSGLVAIRVPAQKYAVFSHRGHVSRLRETLDAIAHEWRAEWGQAARNRGPETPAFFERYTEEFNPQSGMGGIEVWVPIRP